MEYRLPWRDVKQQTGVLLSQFKQYMKQEMNIRADLSSIIQVSVECNKTCGMSAKEKRTKAKYQAEKLSTAHAPEHHFPQFYFSKSRDRDPSENDEHRTQTIVQSEKAMRRGLHCTVPIQYFSLFFLFPFPIFSQYILFFSFSFCSTTGHRPHPWRIRFIEQAPRSRKSSLPQLQRRKRKQRPSQKMDIKQGARRDNPVDSTHKRFKKQKANRNY